MKSVKENIQEIKRLEALIESHCMAADFVKGRNIYLVIYPNGMFPDGAQVRYRKGEKIEALKILLDAMEKHWISNGIN